MSPRLALAALIVSCLGIAGAYALAFLPGGAPVWAVWGMIVGGAGALASTMALGAQRGGRVRPAALVASLLTFMVLVAAFGAAWLVPAPVDRPERLLLGVPLRAALVLYGVGLVPLLFLPLLYAFTFDADTLSEADLERVRGAAASGRRAPTDASEQAP